VEEEEEREEEEVEEGETSVKDVVVTESEVDMEEDEESLKVPHLKRKCAEDSESSQAKRVTVGRRKTRRRGTESKSGTEEDSDDESLFYRAEQRQSFLRRTKHMWDVKVEGHFPDRDKFYI